MSQADQTRQRTVEAAAAVFASRGFEGASTRALGAAAGVNIGTIAYHFGNKEGLYQAALGHAYEQILAYQLPDPLPAGTEARLRLVMADLYRWARGHQEHIRLLLRHVMEGRRLPTEIRDRYTEAALMRLMELQQALPGTNLLAHRMSLLSLNHLLARYAVSDEGDIAPMAGDEVEAAVCQHLGDVAVQLLLGGAPDA